MTKLWHDEAWADYLYWQSQDKKTLKRINQLIKNMERNPFSGIGKPEPLRGELSGLWSRRINAVDRIIYGGDGENLIIYSAKGHYDN